MIDVSELMTDADFGSTTFTRLRPTTTRANEGEASTAYASSSIVGIVQPAATTDAKLLPEGTRIADVQAFFTDAAGAISVGGPGQEPDLLQHGGLTFKALHVQDLGAHGMVKALAQRIHVGTIPTTPPTGGGA